MGGETTGKFEGSMIEGGRKRRSTMLAVGIVLGFVRLSGEDGLAL
jgi:hypothetical protein